MLTELQERILKRLIDNLPLSARQGVNLSDLDDIGLVIGAVKELHKLDYLLSACTTDSAAAILKDKGRDYFRGQLKTKYGEAIMQKIELIDKDIKETREVIASKNLDLIYEKANEIIGIYENDIKGIKDGLKMYEFFVIAFSSNSPPISTARKDYSDDLRLLVKKLEKLRAEVLTTAEAQKELKKQEATVAYYDNSVNFHDKAKIGKRAVINTGDMTNSEEKTTNTEFNIEQKKSFWTKLLPWNWFK